MSQLPSAALPGGYDDYVSIANTADYQPTSAFSIAAWVKLDSMGAGGDNDVILRKGDTSPNNYALAIVDGKVSLQLDAADTAGITGNTVLVTGTWYHILATWDGTTVKLYVNGTLDNGTGTARGGTIGIDTWPLFLGGRSGTTDCLDGVLDDVRIYNYALHSDEVSNLRFTGQARGIKVIKWAELQ